MKSFFAKKLIDILIESTYLGIIFLVPIYFGFIFITDNPFDFQKMIIFKIFLILLVFLSLIKYLCLDEKSKFNQIILKFFKKYWILPLIILIFFLISIFWSVNPGMSFWGSLERQLGWVSLANFFLFSFFLALNLLFSKNKDRKINKIILVASVSGFLVAVYAVLQFLGIDFLTWNEPAAITKRAFSSLGQPNFLGSFLLLSLPLSVYLIKKNNNVYLKALFSLFFLVQFLALIFSGSRGAWMGFLGGVLFFIFYLFFKKNKKVFIIGGISFVLLITSLFLGSNIFSQRLQSSFNFSKGGVLARTSLWPASWNSFLERPWGYGLENQREVLIASYDVNWGTFNKVNVMFDRAHNIFLDILLETGLVGLFICLIFGFFVLRLLFDNIKKDKNKDLSLLILFSLISYSVSLLFGFITTVSALYLCLLFSVMVVLNFDLESFDIKLIKLNFTKKIILIILFLLSVGGVYKQLNNLKNDYYFFKGQQFFYQNEVPSAILVFSYLRENNSRYCQYYYKIIDLIFDNYFKFNDESSRYLAKEEILKIMNFPSGLNNNSFFSLLARAQALTVNEKIGKAEVVFLELEKRSPDYPNVYYKKAKKDVFKRDFSEALINYHQALSLLPEESLIEGEVNLRAFKNYATLIEEEINLIK